MRKKGMLALIPILLVLIAGCVGPGKTQAVGKFTNLAGMGVVIKEFSVKPNKIYEGQTALLFLTLKNSGTITINNGKIIIYGVDPSDFRIVPNGPVVFHLDAADESLGTPGGEVTEYWKLTFVGDLPPGQVFSYNLMARVCYPYETKAYGKVLLMNENEYLRRMANQEIREKPITIENSNAPVQVSVENTQPVVVSNGKLVLKLHITNTGSGYVGPCDGKSKISNFNNISLSVSIPSAGISCEKNFDIYLSQGKSEDITVSCSLPSDLSSPVLTADLLITLRYHYYQDVKTTLQVEGKEGIPTGI